MKINEIKIKDYLTKSNLPASDYVINPYVGCPHGCKYCYAMFMKRFTRHQENWGEFIDIKKCDKKINLKMISGKNIFLSSVTDCYNEYEEKYAVTKSILEQLVESGCNLSISTKSKLILRDIDLLKKIKNVKVCISINTLDESFKDDMDKASSIKDRLHTLKKLHENGIYTVLFMSPIFPYITEWKEIIEISRDYVDEFWFENLNLRGSYKYNILNYIKEKYNWLFYKYIDIFENKNSDYWSVLSNEIEKYCEKNNIKYTNFFYHKELIEKKKEGKKMINIEEFLMEAKKQTYANEKVEKVSSTRRNSKDYEYKKDKMVYHDTYFGGTNFIGEEVVYVDDKTYWAMNYYGVTLDETLGEETMDKALRPALMNVGKDKDVIPVRGPKKWINGEYKYTFDVMGDINCFSGIETIYKNNKKIYELKCNGGLIK
ncbi:radical SAM domain protein [Acholeplasma sp. CAG:878]|nr:radical SAM domain protein [Acholeplasma sp. CAG:878]